MPLLFTCTTQRQTSNQLRKQGVAESQLPLTIQLARQTAESWLHQEIEQDNLPLVIQLVKSKESESSSPVLLEELNDLLVAKFIVRLGFTYYLAKSAAAIVLPFVIKKSVDHLQQNPMFKTWWESMDLRKHLPSKEEIKSTFRTVGKSLGGSTAAENNAYA